MTIGIEQDVFRLQVTVDNVVVVEVLQCQDELSNVELRPGFLESSFPLKVPEKFASRHVVSDQVEV